MRAVFGGALVGVYVSGSVALGDYVAGVSDIDVFAVVDGVPDRQYKEDAVAALLEPPMEIPARGLEFVLYGWGFVRAPSPDAGFEVNLNTGSDMTHHVSLDPGSEPAHWFVLDRAIVRAAGVAAIGPLPEEVFAPLPRRWLLQALKDSIEWHRSHDAGGPDSVLNAARALCFVREGRWLSKTAAAEGAARYTGAAGTLESALTARIARRAGPDEKEAEPFLDLVVAEIDAALEEESGSGY